VNGWIRVITALTVGAVAAFAAVIS